MAYARPILIALATLLAVAGRATAATVTVFAAASLTDSLKQIATDYRKVSGDEIVFNFAASGVLARQIEAGAPADLFFSADEAQMDRLAAGGALVPESRHDLLENSLVIVTPPDNTTVHSARDLTNAAVGHIAVGDVKLVPAGNYARWYLEKIGVWNWLRPKLIPCESVRAVLAAVEAGNADAGVVYNTDAAISRKVKVACAVPPADGLQIRYPIALLTSAPQAKAAGKFLAFLQSDTARATFEHAGFGVVR